MTVQIQSPPGVNVAVRNPGTIVYLQGNESTDGSIRFQIVTFQGAQVAEIQTRAGGIWASTSIKTGPNSVVVGLVVTLSAAGSNLITTDAVTRSHFLARSSVDDNVTIELANIINARTFIERQVLQSDESGEFTGIAITTQDVNTAFHLISQKFYLKTGATAATEPVRIQAWRGTDDTGVLLFDQSYPASDFPANVETELTLEGFLEFTLGEQNFTRISSDATFSLKTNAAVDAWFFAIDLSIVTNDDLLQTDEWISGDNFDKGVWTTQDRKVYEANETGVQAGTFEDNLDKWDQLISVQGFDRILNSVNGSSIADNSGNLLVGSA